MAFELAVRFVMIAPDAGFFDGAVHSLDLTVGPGMLGFGQPVFNAELGAGIFKAMSPNGLAFGRRFNDQGDGRSPRARRREVSSVVGQDDVDPEGNGFDQVA